MKNIQLENLGNRKYATVVEWGRKMTLSISEYKRWDGFPMVQVFEAGMPYATLSRTVISSKKYTTCFIADLSEVNISLLRQLISQKIITLSGQYAEIQWPDHVGLVNPDLTWQEMEEVMNDGENISDSKG